MAQKLYRTGIKREKDYMYYIKNGAIWAAPMKRRGVKGGRKIKIEQFADASSMDYSKFLYYIDKDGDVAASAKKARKAKKAKAKK
jgi:hypothetical protein